MYGRKTAPAPRTQRQTPGTKKIAMKQARRNSIVMTYRFCRRLNSALVEPCASVITAVLLTHSAYAGHTERPSSR